MKTIKEIKQELDDQINSVKKDTTKSELEATKRRVSFLRQCLRYIETCPREEFIKEQRTQVQKRIDLLPTHYQDWQVGKVITKYKDPYKAFTSEMGLSSMQATLKTLDYLLS
jgi:hypothetical protein